MSDDKVVQEIFDRQDHTLDDLARVTARLGESAVVINQELQDQQRLLHELDMEMDRQYEKMNFVMGKLGKLLRTNDLKQLMLVLVLLLVAVFLFILNILV